MTVVGIVQDLLGTCRQDLTPFGECGKTCPSEALTRLCVALPNLTLTRYSACCKHSCVLAATCSPPQNLQIWAGSVYKKVTALQIALELGHARPCIIAHRQHICSLPGKALGAIKSGRWLGSTRDLGRTAAAFEPAHTPHGDFTGVCEIKVSPLFVETTRVRCQEAWSVSFGHYWINCGSEFGISLSSVK